VDCGDNSTFNITDEITVAAWIKVNKLDADWQAIVTKGDTTWRLQRYQATSNIEFTCTGLDVASDPSGWGILHGEKSVNDGQWHHIAGVYDGRFMTLYMDGKTDVSCPATGSINVNNYKVFIGANSHFQDPREWNGLIDDVRIYSYALSETEIKALYHDKEPPSKKD